VRARAPAGLGLRLGLTLRVRGALAVFTGRRPAVDLDAMPPRYSALLQECWATDPAARPGFAEIIPRMRELITDERAARAAPPRAAPAPRGGGLALRGGAESHAGAGAGAAAGAAAGATRIRGGFRDDTALAAGAEPPAGGGGGVTGRSAGAPGAGPALGPGLEAPDRGPGARGAGPAALGAGPQAGPHEAAAPGLTGAVAGLRQQVSPFEADLVRRSSSPEAEGAPPQGWGAARRPAGQDAA
jgi:hypothetical protein